MCVEFGMNKEEIEINEIIFCKNYLGFDVFSDIEKSILKDVYSLDEQKSFEDICRIHGVNRDYLNELTRTYDNVKTEILNYRRNKTKSR